MTQILENLYLGGKRDAHGSEYDLIFSVLSTSEVYETFGRVIRIDDTTEQEITDIVKNTADQLEVALAEGKKVLVHCHAGVSRSAALVLGYLILKRGMTYIDAYIHVRLKRNICPNDNFVEQLKKIESTLTAPRD